MTETGARWEAVYRTKQDDETSWFEPVPQLSLDLIAGTGAGPDAAIVDVGAGASRLIDGLLARGYTNLTALDLSESALARTRARLAPDAPVTWVVGDLRDWRPATDMNIWHDRAVFHFLTDEDGQAAYLATLDAALRSGGHAIIGTFAPDGPAACSGLPVMRYDADTLAARLGAGYAMTRTLRHAHHTPWGSVQNFHTGVFRKL